jgi:hypothetical protein
MGDVANELARRRSVLRLAAEAEVDVRTAERALDEGLEGIRTRVVRARIERAATALGIMLGRDGGAAS